MNERNYKIARLYVLSLILIISYYFLDNSETITELIENNREGRDSGIIMFVFSAIIKYGSLVIGLGIFIFLSFFIIKEKLAPRSISKRNLTLLVSHDFGQVEKTISKKATNKIIRNTMNSINWNEFHIVQLENENGNKALHVSGNLSDDGLASGFVTEDDHILLVKPLQTVDQMTEILLDFLKGEEIWRNKYEYK
ncbi:hypothetical protein [Psychroserpens mesophilus]|uniref:hypothetical protein n=1 Tax=Psychroserpens mesophilus TaxID=325473 RepID=UPI000693C470|nr:hypothetical protein [Psychroserpens mesophilus]